jgi:hypothetical protein
MTGHAFHLLPPSYTLNVSSSYRKYWHVNKVDHADRQQFILMEIILYEWV